MSSEATGWKRWQGEGCWSACFYPNLTISTLRRPVQTLYLFMRVEPLPNLKCTCRNCDWITRCSRKIFCKHQCPAFRRMWIKTVISWSYSSQVAVQVMGRWPRQGWWPVVRSTGGKCEKLWILTLIIEHWLWCYQVSLVITLVTVLLSLTIWQQ